MSIKAYHLITLFDIIGKTFESILIKKISAITKIYHFLSNTHFGGRRNTLMEYAVIKKDSI